ncbi:hypothetical protein SNE40_010862 [Patella caerulea]|uniref:Uncharacterized protein n=1 Tax=Patella caerulea TaxID=87958 RepID=A0AAN8JZ28_PATCE
MLQLHRHGMFQNRPVDGYVTLTPHLFRGDRIGFSGCVDCFSPDVVVGTGVNDDFVDSAADTVVGGDCNDSAKFISVVGAVLDGEVSCVVESVVIRGDVFGTDVNDDFVDSAADADVIGSVAGAVVCVEVNCVIVVVVVLGDVNDDIVSDGTENSNDFVDSAVDTVIVDDCNDEVIGSVAGAVIGVDANGVVVGAVIRGDVNHDIVDAVVSFSLSEPLVLRFPGGVVVTAMEVSCVSEAVVCVVGSVDGVSVVIVP